MSDNKPTPPISASASALWNYFVLARLHKFPLGASLMFWPGAWGIVLSARMVKMAPQEVVVQTLLCLVGETLVHNAACIWNDMCDREYDRQVERTKTRPLASGAISMAGAGTFLLAHVIVCCLFLTLAGLEGLKVGLVGLFVFNPIYPLTKRWTHWPQAWLGPVMTWGLAVAWVSIQGYTNLDALAALFFGGICWTIYYDTIYGCQDRRDDVKAGVKSTAVLFGAWVRPILTFFASLVVFSLVAAGRVMDSGPSYFAITVGGGVACFAWQMATLDFDDDKQCLKAFKANGNLVGFVLWAGMFVDYLQYVGVHRVVL
ncbi:UbiA prenyltransferase [Trametes meyenii]|nr:UbiA prenyltransferase [Trametes meyenii]